MSKALKAPKKPHKAMEILKISTPCFSKSIGNSHRLPMYLRHCPKSKSIFVSSEKAASL